MPKIKDHESVIVKKRDEKDFKRWKEEERQKEEEFKKAPLSEKIQTYLFVIGCAWIFLCFIYVIAQFITHHFFKSSALDSIKF